MIQNLPKPKGPLLFVIHALPDPNTAVYGTYRRLCEFLSRHGFQAEILTPLDFNIRESWLRLLPLIYPFLVAHRLFRLKTRYSIMVFHSYSGWIVNRFRSILLPDHCITVTAYHGLEPLFFEALKQESKRSGSPLSFRFRLLQWIMIKLMRASTQQSDFVHCLNEAERDYLVSREWTKPERIKQLSNCVENTFFREHEYRERAVRILFVGTWLNIKGIRYLVQAFEQVCEADPFMVLICAGTGSTPESLQKFFPETLVQRISIIPRLPHDELPPVYEDADIFVLPSLSEGFSKALLEAMAAGLPVITTPVGASPELISDGENGLVIPPADGNSLAAAILRLAADRPLREKLGIAAQRTARLYTTEDVFRTIAESLQMEASF